jgi:hypothetical protein
VQERVAAGLVALPGDRPGAARAAAALRAAGRPASRLFVNGDGDAASWRREFGLEVTAHWPALPPAGHWALCLAELFIRDPRADRYLLAGPGCPAAPALSRAAVIGLLSARATVEALGGAGGEATPGPAP